MKQTRAKTTRLDHRTNANGHILWRLISGGKAEIVVEAHQFAQGRTEVRTLPSSRQAGYLPAPCTLEELTVELVGRNIIVSAPSGALAQIPTRACKDCGGRTAAWHAVGLCAACAGPAWECDERKCRICYPPSWASARSPLRHFTVIFERTLGGGTTRIDDVQAHNEAEARTEAMYEAFPDYDADAEGADRFWDKHVANCYVVETVPTPA